MLQLIDRKLNSITMYRLMLYGLSVLAGISIVLGFLGILPFTGIQFIVTLTIILVVCGIAKIAFIKITGGATNNESALITSLILFFILAPVTSISDALVVTSVSAMAIASKYIFAIHKKHIFNPAASAVFIMGLLGFGNAIWWVGSMVLLPFVVVLGLLVVRKIRRFHLFFAFLVASLVTISIANLRNGLTVTESLFQAFTSWPLIFFGTIMLTEPMTTPPRKALQIDYGGLVGFLFGLQFQIGPLFSSPEFALVVGNIFSYCVSPKQKLFLTLKQKIRLAPQMFEFVFTGPNAFHFLPGQYLEWTLPETQGDSRGNRRYFTIASAPTEKDIRLGIKVIDVDSSKFKETLASMPLGSPVVASQLAGDFVLPNDSTKKLVFIGGGIGITPFRSMTAWLLDMHQKRDIVLFYACSTPSEFVYKDIFAQAQKQLGIKTVYVITDPKNTPKDWNGETGYITQAMVSKYVPDVANRLFYLSGPNAMVEAYKSLLRRMGVGMRQMITDYFPGF